MRTAVILIAGLAIAMGCQSGPQPQAESEEKQEAEDPRIVHGEMVEGVTVDHEVCSGNLVPPSGYRQETAFAPITVDNPYDEAAEAARARLRDLICQGHRCAQAESLVRIWRVGQDGRRACVMAVAGTRDIEEFLIGPRRNLEAGLVEVAAAIATRLREESSEKGLSVVVGAINDHGVSGGPRAEWLHDQLLTALAAEVVDTRMPPPHWTGLGTPAASTAVIQGRIRELPGQEAMLEVSWRLHFDERRVQGMGNIEFPLAISPTVDPETHMPPLPAGSGKVALEMDSRPGGGLCDGQETQIWLETAEPVHVRVINLYGRGEGGLVVYSTGAEKLAANQPISLGKFRAVSVGDVPVERFLVVAAPTLEKLGRYASIDQACRLPGSIAQALHQQGRGLPAEAMEWFGSRDFRLMSGEECADVEPSDAFDLALLDGLPTCW